MQPGKWRRLSLATPASEELSLLQRKAASRLQLSLASGLTWGIRASDERSQVVLQALAGTARLPRLLGAPDRFLVVRDASLAPTPDAGSREVTYDLCQDLRAGLGTDMARACTVLVLRTPGALLLHGALVVRDGRGVILTGPGGYGKTTTARRLPPPWQALSDDASLVVPDRAGRFVAHPWPTWSRVLSGSNETWDVQRWVPLEQVFCLGHSERDEVEAVGQGAALCLLLASAEQVRSYLPVELVDGAQRLRDLENATTLVKSVPVRLLRFSIAGPVWLAMEEALGLGRAAS